MFFWPRTLSRIGGRMAKHSSRSPIVSSVFHFDWRAALRTSPNFLPKSATGRALPATSHICVRARRPTTPGVDDGLRISIGLRIHEKPEPSVGHGAGGTRVLLRVDAAPMQKPLNYSRVSDKQESWRRSAPQSSRSDLGECGCALARWPAKSEPSVVAVDVNSVRQPPRTGPGGPRLGTPELHLLVSHSLLSCREPSASRRCG